MQQVSRPYLDPMSSGVPALLGACCFGSMAALRACDSILPALAIDFSITLGQAARTIFAFAVSYGFFQLFFGPLGDRYGKLRIISVCALACVIANSLVFFSPTLDWMVTARIVSGACAAGIFPLALAWLGDNVPYAARQAALAKLVSAGVMGMLAGQWLSGLIAEWIGWRPVFLLIALTFLGAGVLLMRLITKLEPPSPQTSSSGRRLRDILKIPAARWILSVVFIEGALALGALAFMPSLLQRHHDVSLSTAGGIAAFYAIGGALYTRMAVRLLGRIGEAGLARLGGTLLCVGLASFAYSPVLWWTPVACLITGFGFYSLHNTLQTNATQMAPAARGAAMSMFACCLFIGQSVGISGVAWMADRGAEQIIFVLAGVSLLALSAAVAWKGPPKE